MREIFRVDCPYCGVVLYLKNEEVQWLNPLSEANKKYYDPEHGLSPVRFNGWNREFKAQFFCRECGKKIIKKKSEITYVEE